MSPREPNQTDRSEPGCADVKIGEAAEELNEGGAKNVGAARLALPNDVAFPAQCVIRNS